MAMNIGITLTLPDDNKFRGAYTLNLGECTGIDDIDCLRETGMTVPEVLSQLTTKTGMSAITAAVILWLVRRRDFPTFTFRVAAEAIPWDTDFKLEDAFGDEEGKVSESEESPSTTGSNPTLPTSTESDPGNSTS